MCFVILILILTLPELFKNNNTSLLRLSSFMCIWQSDSIILESYQNNSFNNKLFFYKRRLISK